MPRPQRCRRVCNKPTCTSFSPDKEKDAVTVVLTMDEFEVIRLVDLEKQTHEQCAKQMEISRSTVTEIYQSAREKIADSLVNGHGLEISGGNYRFCDGVSKSCYKKQCKKRQRVQKQYVAEKTEIEKGRQDMKIAVTYENGEIFQHFGHTEQFKLYEVENGKVTASEVVDTNGSGHGALAGFLFNSNINVLICGGIGGGAQAALAEAGIQLYGGVSGDADAAVNAFLAGELAFNPNVHCNHHDHGEAHTCGEHGCGQHNCH